MDLGGRTIRSGCRPIVRCTLGCTYVYVMHCKLRTGGGYVSVEFRAVVGWRAWLGVGDNARNSPFCGCDLRLGVRQVQVGFPTPVVQVRSKAFFFHTLTSCVYVSLLYMGGGESRTRPAPALCLTACGKILPLPYRSASFFILNYLFLRLLTPRLDAWRGASLENAVWCRALFCCVGSSLI